MNETVLTIIFVAGVTAIFSYFSYKKKQSAWEGVLEDKKVSHGFDDDGSSTKTYKLIFRLTTGKKLKLTVNRPTFDLYTIGKNYEKVKGEYMPKEKL